MKEPGDPFPTADHIDVTWLISANVSLQLLLLLLIITILVYLNYAPQPSFNKLTLLPYYWLIPYTLVSIVMFGIINFFS